MTEADTKTQALAAFYADPILAARVLVPHWFPKKMPWVHRGLVAILLRRTDFLLNFGAEGWEAETAEWTREDLDLLIKWFVWEKPDGTRQAIFKLSEGPDGLRLDMALGRFTAIMMPRGSAKTTVHNFVKLFEVLYKLTKFTLLVSETGTHANRQLDNIKAEIESNERIVELFGNLKPDRQSSIGWTQSESETTTGVFLVARGRGGQVRGLNHKGNRPDNLSVDDLEDEESVSTAEQRDKSLTWVLKSLLPVLPQLNASATATFLGTMLHRESVMMKFAVDPEWTFIRFGAKLPDGSWLWPEYMDAAKWESTKQSYAGKGKLGAFYMEYGSEARDEDSAKFKPQWFQNIIQPRKLSEMISRAIVIDPAISQKIGADRTAIAVVGMTEKGKIHICDVWGKRGADPREQIDMYFELSRRWDCTHHGVESIAYQAALIHLLREEMFRKKRYFEIKPITHSAKKTERIEGVLQPRYAAGYISHQREFPIINSMLLDWPNGGFDDVDAVAMAITLLDPFAALAGDPNHNWDDDEYEDLEKLVGGPIRHAP